MPMTVLSGDTKLMLLIADPVASARASARPPASASATWCLAKAIAERSALPNATERLAAPWFADGVSDAGSRSTLRRLRHITISPTAPDPRGTTLGHKPPLKAQRYRGIQPALRPRSTSHVAPDAELALVAGRNGWQVSKSFRSTDLGEPTEFA